MLDHTGTEIYEHTGTLCKREKDINILDHCEIEINISTHWSIENDRNY
jgi:hypothetical protein